MKNITIITLAIIGAIIASSCSTVEQMYQVLSLKQVDNISENSDGNFVSNYDNVQVEYNFWEQNGKLYFVITNTGKHDVSLHMDKSFFIINGEAFDYYKGRSYSNSNSSSLLSGNTTTSGNNNGDYTSFLLSNLQSVTTHNRSNIKSSSNYFSAHTTNATSYSEPLTITIPANTYRQICYFELVSTLYRDCELLLCNFKKMNNKASSDTISFTQDNAPISFTNRIAYTVADNPTMHYINDSFYVESITNGNEDYFYEKVKQVDPCGEVITQHNSNLPSYLQEKDATSTYTTITIQSQYSPRRFYITYIADSSTPIH